MLTPLAIAIGWNPASLQRERLTSLVSVHGKPGGDMMSAPVIANFPPLGPTGGGKVNAIVFLPASRSALQPTGRLTSPGRLVTDPLKMPHAHPRLGQLGQGRDGAGSIAETGDDFPAAPHLVNLGSET